MVHKPVGKVRAEESASREGNDGEVSDSFGVWRQLFFNTQGILVVVHHSHLKSPTLEFGMPFHYFNFDCYGLNRSKRVQSVSGSPSVRRETLRRFFGLPVAAHRSNLVNSSSRTNLRA